MPVSGCVADASTYAHYLFNAFDTTSNGSIKFEVPTTHHHHHSENALNKTCLHLICTSVITQSELSIFSL